MEITKLRIEIRETENRKKNNKGNHETKTLVVL